VPSLRDLADRVLGRRPAPPPRLELPRVPTSEEILADLDRFYDDVDDRVPGMVVSMRGEARLTHCARRKSMSWPPSWK
jgi:hypothetical protein